MLVPGIQQRMHIPHFVLPTLLSLLAIVVGIAAWGALSLRTANEDGVVHLPQRPNLTSIAYIVPEGGRDVVYIRSREAGSTPERVASFPNRLKNHARGSASPDGRVLAIVAVADTSAVEASMTFIRPGADNEITVASSQFDLVTGFAWSPTGDRVAGQLSSKPNAAGKVTTTIIEANPETGATRELATYRDVILATPVAYSPDGSSLFIVTIGESGSWIWEKKGDELTRRGQLAAGRTSDWRLSPDGSRLAFIDVRGGERNSIGRTFVFATGTVRTETSTDAQVGVTWRPGVALPEFGGPGGTVRLNPQPEDGSYIVPLEWSPDGTTLVAKVIRPRVDPLKPEPPSLELMTATSRLHAAEVPGATFIGWVAG